MDVCLTKVIDPAQGADQFTTPDNGERFVGAVFKLKGVTGSLQDDTNNDATLIGSNGQTYEADFDNIAGYTNFNSGEFNFCRNPCGSPEGPSPKGRDLMGWPWPMTAGAARWQPSRGRVWVRRVLVPAGRLGG
jgi:hypothetical protein